MRVLVLLALALLPATSHAATYTLSGSKVTSCTPGEFEACHSFDGVSFDGEITIRKRLIGTLAWRNLYWEVGADGSRTGLPFRALSLDLPAPGLPGFTLDGTFKHPIAGSRLQILTGARGEVMSWSLDIFDGPPDYMLSGNSQWQTSSLLIYAGDAEWRGSGGTLTRGRRTAQAGPPAPAPVPVPAAGWLLAGGLAALAAVRRRRTVTRPGGPPGAP